MRGRLSRVRAGLGIGLAVMLLAGCNVDATSNTGIRINVTYHESVPADGAAGIVDTLRFYVAVEHPGEGVYILNDSASGIVVDVTERNLLFDPYQLLVSRGGNWMKRIRVVVVGERNGQAVLFGQLSDPTSQAFENGRIVQRTIKLRPPESSFDLSWTVTGCLISSMPRNPEYDPFTFGSLDDKDCDGWNVIEDCDDTDPLVNPGVEEGFDCDGVDNNCDGIVDPGGNEDGDSDGVTACDGDCNDYDPTVYPGAPELCDAQDNDCNGKCDDGQDIDADRDGFADCGDFGSFIDHEGGTCAWVPNPDCDDTNPTVHPGADEQCNGRDDNCNGQCDEGLDPDGDGYTACGSTDPMTDPPEGMCTDMQPYLQDCGPENPAVHPEADEVCDGVDNNCDGIYAEGTSACYEWGSSDEECRLGTMSCAEGGGGEAWGDCSSSSAELVPLAKCGIWPNCAQNPNPALCMDTVMHWRPMTCHLHYYGEFNAGMCGAAGGRPTYFMPFGFSGNSNCHWHLMLNPGPNQYTEIGLVDPNVPGEQPSDLIESCEAALVVNPNAAVTENPGTVSGIISFYYDNGNGDFYGMEIPFSVNPVTTCDPVANEKLTCQFSN